MSEKKYNLPKRTTIGKQSDEDPGMMVPNMNYLKFFPDAELPDKYTRTNRSRCIHIGTYIVISKIIKQYKLDEIIERIICRDSGLFLDLTAYSIIIENNAGQYYPEYAYNHPLFTKSMIIYSDAKVSKFE